MDEKLMATEKQVDLMKKLNIEVPRLCTKDQAMLLIQEKLGGQQEKTPKTKGEFKHEIKDNRSYYVAYAKDLVIASIASNRKPEASLSFLMQEAIEVIKQAQEAFK